MNVLRISLPNPLRKTVAAVVFITFWIIGSVIRFSRPDFNLFPILEPLDFKGTMPNFLVCAAVPILVFLTNQTVKLADHVKNALGAAVGLSVYEVVQIWMPRRTFDVGDMIASFLGAVFSIIVATWLFYGNRNEGAR